MEELKTILVVTPHPDDAEGGVGGTIARWTAEGCKVVLVVTTNGSHGTSDRSVKPEDLAKTREQEQRNAAKVLGISEVVFLGLPDQGLEDTSEFREKIVRQIRKHKPDADLIECKHQAKYLSTVNGDEQLELSHLNGKRIGSFSGIATPESFEAMLRDNNADIVCNRRFLDHHKFTSRELENYFEDAVASKAEYVVTTEKDAVRIDPNFKPILPLYYLRMEIEILSGAGDFEEAVNRVCFPQTEYSESTDKPLSKID